ncbi:MAG: sigma-70 family RNA polymerase sigma factor [Crocinitomix sp.]|nr:sigma-70 family RNA polymerase sigma factor [Crocinitomix sp.]
MKNEEILHIISQIKAGDSNAFAQLVDTYKDMVYSLCLKMTNSTENAEEIAQDSFVKAFQGLQRFKGKAKFSTWLYQITYYTCINFLRKNKLDTSDVPLENFEDNSAEILDQIQQTERREYISKAMAYLSPTERALITFYYLEERTIKEIAIITKMSIANVKVKLHRTRKKLYGKLELLLKNEVNSLVD